MSLSPSAARDDADIRGTSSRIHVVGSEGELCVDPSGMSSWLKDIGMIERGTKYFVVGIMGAQSSGKSTLLNLLFGTGFDELDASTGRQMTTKGVWLGSSPRVDGALVMDLEGTDSVTRGVERHPFERQSALLGLSVAEVLIINMWQHDIGRYVASNYGVLATVFEVNLELLQEQLKDESQRTKTMLMFCIRDHLESDSPLSVISAQLTADTQRIWEELKKPEGLEHIQVSDIFDVRFVALPHKKYENAAFLREVNALRERFTEPSNPEYLLSGSYHMQKSASVPINGFGMYVSTIWQTIQNHKDLNLPSQKEMLATYRCDELLQEACAEFTTSLLPLRKRVLSTFVETFGKEISALVASALESFSSSTAGYHQETVDRKKAELRARLLEETRPLAAIQTRHIRDTCVCVFNESILELLPSDPKQACDNFMDSVNTSRKLALEKMQAMLQQTSESESSEDEEARRQLVASLESCEKDHRTQQVQVVLSMCRASVKVRGGLVSRVKACLDEASPHVWRRVCSAFTSWCVHLDSKHMLYSKIQHMGMSPQEVDGVIDRIMDVALTEIEDQLGKHAAFIKMKMQNRFDSLFRLDAEGLPRKWHQEKNIRDIFIAARDEALTILQLFREFVVDVEDDDKKLEGLAGFRAKYLSRLDRMSLISDENATDRKQQFLQECEISLRGAEAAQARAFELARTPMWVFPLIAILGFNEFMAVVTSPFLLIFVLFVGISCSVIYFLNLTQPALAIAKLAVSQASAAASAFLETTTEPAPHAPARRVSPPSSSASSDDSPSPSPTTEMTSLLRKRVQSQSDDAGTAGQD